MKVRTAVRCVLLLACSCCCLLPQGFAQAFSVSAGVTAVTVHPGDTNVAVPVSLGGDGTYSGPVTVTLTGLPSGITVTPLTLTPGSSGTLMMSASVAADQEAFPASDPANADSATSTATVVAFVGAQQSTATFALTVSLENPSFAPQPSAINLPIVTINTSGVPIADKTTDVPGTITITSADGQTLYLPGVAGTDNTATFHIHGNSTAEMPKKPYDVKLNTSTDLLGGMGLQCGYVTSSGKPTCDKSKSYILLANYDDKTLLRDWSASALANAIPIGGSYLNESANSPSPSGTSTLMPWASHSIFVEVYLNGQYEGNYQLIEEVKVDSHRVNITEMTDTNTSGNGLTGGYLMEIDQRQDEDYTWVTPHGVYMGLLDPDFSPEVPEQTSYISNYVNAAEAALFSSNYTDPNVGWRAYFDEASAVNFYIVNDVLGNVDGGNFFSSDYVYKDEKNPLLYMGPVWDFDISSGNVNYDPIIDPTIPWIQARSPWYGQLFTDPSFKAAAQQQWNALKSNGVFSAWLRSISAEAATLEQSQRNNFGRWPMQGIRVWPNPQANGSYDGEVSYLENWITLRMGYMDAFLNGLPPTSIAMTVPPGTIRTGTPVTLTAKVTGDNPTGTVTFSYDSIVIGQAGLDDTGTATLTASTIAPGNWYIEAYYNGDSKNAISGVLGPNVNVLPPLIQTTANLSATGTFSYGSPVTVTAAVVGVSGNTAPTGSFAFAVNGTPVASVPVAANGVASFTTSTLSPGSNVMQATYSGDLTYAASTTNIVSASEGQGVASLTLGNLNTTYTGGAQTVTVTTQPSGLNYTVTYNGVATAPSAPGTYSVVATVNDPDYTGTATGTLTIAKAVADVNWEAPTAITYGTALSTMQLNATASVPGSFTYSPAPGTVLSAGTQTISATLTPADSTDFVQVTKSVQIAVTKQASATTLSASATSIVPNQTVALTASVAGAISGSPTGTISFFDGSSLLATQAVVNGTATYSTASLLSGSHTLTATYNGDGNYSSSSSTGGAVIAVAPLDFTFSNNGLSSVTLSANGSATLAYALAPTYGTYPGQVSFTVTGLPSTLRYTVSQSQIAPNAGPVDIWVTIAAAESTAMNRQNGRTAVAWALLLLGPLALGRARRRAGSRMVLVLLLGISSCVALSMVTGCGQTEAEQTYNVTVTATSGAMQHSAAGVVTLR